MAEYDAIRAYGLKNPVAVIPNGIDLPVERGIGSPDWAATLPADARVLLYLGRIHPKKNLPALLTAWKKARVSGWHLVIAGWDQGGHERELRHQVARLSADKNVHFVGPKFDKEKDASFRRADAFVLPSLSEGLPMVVLEAWSYGLPVMMTAACNLPEGFAAGAAMQVATDSDELSGQLSEFLDLSDSQRQAMGRFGELLVRQNFSWNRVASEIASVYQWLERGASLPTCVNIR